MLPALQPILNELTQRFGERLTVLPSQRPNEIYFESGIDLVPGFCAQLYKKWNARLVSLFADDVRDIVGKASKMQSPKPKVQSPKSEDFGLGTQDSGLTPA